MADPLIPSYHKDYFVDREGEVSRVHEKVQRLLKGERPHLPHTLFYGPRGRGKSWLLRYLACYLQEKEEFQNRVRVLYLVLVRGESAAGEGPAGTLELEAAKANADPEAAVGQVLSKALEQLGLSPVPRVDLAQASAWLVERVREGKPLVVLVDGLDEASPSLLGCLESYYLAVLAKEPNVLLVLGSRVPRPQGYTWRMMELRYKVEEFQLESFDKKQTEEQLQKLQVDPSVADEVGEAGEGNPLSNAVLGKLWKKDKAEALQRCAEELLDGVDEELRGYFWALCPLPAVYEEQMPPLLAAYFGKDPSVWSFQSCRRILQDMVATRLTRWQAGEGYVMDPAVRSVLTRALQENDPPRWEKLKQASVGQASACPTI